MHHAAPDRRRQQLSCGVLVPEPAAGGCSGRGRRRIPGGMCLPLTRAPPTRHATHSQFCTGFAEFGGIYTEEEIQARIRKPKIRSGIVRSSRSERPKRALPRSLRMPVSLALPLWS